MQSRVYVWAHCVQPMHESQTVNFRPGITSRLPHTAFFNLARQGRARLSPERRPLAEYLVGQHSTALRPFPTKAQFSRKLEKVVPEAQRRLHTEVTDVVLTKVPHLQKINDLGTKNPNLG
jgi:hypothetical protein